MARITSDCVERVRDAVDFLGLVGERTELRRATAHSYEALCPFHDERTPSFTIDPDRKLYYCFGCQASGDVFTYVQALDGVDFPTALERLADRCGIEVEYEDEDPRASERRNRRQRLHALLERASAHYARLLWESSEAAGTRAYLLGRGLGEQSLRHFQVGYAPGAWDHVLRFAQSAGFSEEELRAAGLIRQPAGDRPPTDYFRGRIMFPLRDARGRVVGFGARATRADQRPKYLNSPDGPLYHKGRYLYGGDIARAHATRAGQVVVCEGYTDVIALHQAGVEHAVGLMGTAMTDEQLGELARLANTVLLCLDADRAGEEAMLRAAGSAARRRLELRVVPLPAGSDPAALAQAGGREALQTALDASVPLVRFQVQQTLARGDHGTGEGRDRTVERLRPVFATLAPSATRLELTRIVADTLQLPASLLEQLLDERRDDRSAARPAPLTGPVPLGGEQETERAFLALCLALPEPAATMLSELDLSAHFTSDPLRHAAEHLRANGLDPAGWGLRPGGCEPLAGTLAGLTVQSAREPASLARLEAQHQQLRLAALERQLRAARMRGDGSAAELARRRAATKARFEAAYVQALEDQER